MTHILHIDASARSHGSISRALSAEAVENIGGGAANVTVTRRDLANGLPQVDEAWVGATFTPKEARTDAQRGVLELSDALIDELRAANVIVIGMPVYNFSVPAALKAWIDLVARVGETFAYTETGPKGLLGGKRAVVAYASGGVPLGSDLDFASDYLRHIFGFLGISEVEFVVTPVSRKVAAA